MRTIFISYRRDDAEGQAGRLYDDLTQYFGDNAVFMDVAAIEPGRDFRRAIDDHLSSCGVLLAIIGKSWLTAKDESGIPRLNNAMDFVRVETASALKRDIPVVPVLVQGAKMPRAEDLPEDLKELAFRNGVELTHARWDSDVQVLVKALCAYVQTKQEQAKVRRASAPSEQSSNTVVSIKKIIALLVGVFVLAFGGYIGQQLFFDESAYEAVEAQETKIIPKETVAPNRQGRADAEVIGQSKGKGTDPSAGDVSGYWRDDEGILYRIVADKNGNFDMGRIEPPEDSGIYRNVRIDGREIEIAIGVLPSGTQQEIANLELSIDGNIMAGLRRSTQIEDLPINWILKRVKD